MMYRRHRAAFDAIADHGARVNRICELNVEMQVRSVASIPTIENAWARGQSLQLNGWIYGIHDGLLRDLGPTLTSIAERDALVSIDERALAPVEPESGVRRQAIDAFGGEAFARAGDVA